MRQSVATLTLLLAGTACAQDVVSFFFPGGSGYDGVDPVATINTANPSTTEFHIACPTGVASSKCGWGPGLDVTILSQTRFQAEMSTEGVSMSLGCDYNKKDVQMTCTVNQKGGNDDTAGKAITATLSKEDVKFLTATVVEGQSLLSGGGSGSASTKASASSSLSAAPRSTATPAAAAATTTASTVATSARSTSSGVVSSRASSSSSSAASAASAASATPTRSSSASIPESTGAAPKYGVEGSALLALVGAAALHLW